LPLEIEQLEVLTGVPDNEQLVSVEENPEPDTSALAPTEAESGLSVIDAVVVTVKVAEAESPPGLPLAVIVYTPDAMSPTVNVAVKAPPETEQVDAVTGLPESEQVVSLARKLEPDTWTVAPTWAEDGLSVIDGGTPLTVKVAVAESSAWAPVAVTV